MKKYLCIILALVAILMLTSAAFAAAPEAPAVPVESEVIVDAPDTNVGGPMTWAYLATIAGATAFTLLIVQFLKIPLDKVWKIPTRVFVYIVSLMIMLLATAFTSGLTPNTALLTAVNAFVVALAAYGSYEVTFAKVGK